MSTNNISFLLSFLLSFLFQRSMSPRSLSPPTSPEVGWLDEVSVFQIR